MMTTREAFGPNLRRIRLQRGVSLESIAASTHVPIALWESLEDNDLYGWPNGVLARAFVREYARQVGLDPEETVNEFCRLFPHGDRRRHRIMAELARATGEPGSATDEEVPGERREPMRAARRERLAICRARVLSAAVDVTLVAVAAQLAGTLRTPFGYAARVAGAAVLCLAVRGIILVRSRDRMAAHAGGVDGADRARPQPFAARFLAAAGSRRR